MRRVIFVVVLVAAAVVVPTAAAAQDQANESDVEELETEECAERITEDGSVRLCRAELRDGEAVLVLESDRLHRVTVTDVTAMMTGSGGSMPKRNYQIDGRTTLRVPVEPVDGKAGVTIDVAGELHGEPLQYDRPLVGGPWSVRDVQLAVAISVVVGVLAVPLVEKLIYGALERDRLL